MVDCFINDSSLSAIADAIRKQTGHDSTWKLYPYQMAGEIRKDLGNVKEFVEGTLTHLTDNKVSYVAPYAFYNYTALSEVSMPACTQIDDLAFAGCTMLQTISFPLCSAITAQTFASCKNIAQAALGLTEISSNANADTHTFVLSVAAGSLRTLELPQCSYIGSRAFLHKSKFKYPNLNKVIAQNCTLVDYAAFSGGTTLVTFEAANCTSISKGAFNGCTNLSSAYFPLCDTILDDAFNKCTSLTDVYLPICNTNNTTVFANCKEIKVATIGSTDITSTTNPLSAAISALQELSISQCLSIGMNTFKDYVSLSKIDAERCTNIDTSAFAGCTHLDYISFPACQHIGMSAFCGCSGLTYCDFSACQTLGACAFQDCANISYMSLPACSHIGHSVFLNCEKLYNLTLPGPVMVVLDSTDAFDNTPIMGSSKFNAYGSIYVPNNLVDSYKVATNWSNFSSQIYPIADFNQEE